MKTCPCCKRKRVGPIKQWRRNTKYHDYVSNYMTCCVHCIEEDDLHYAYMWAEYYNGTGVGYSHYTDHIINRRPWRTK